jgi:4-amino-4-deoxy-L-arabinose transferase-like glycosyltransferase
MLVKLALAVPFLGRYGWQRDELYFLQASRHVALGYVDFPPATALLARAVTVVAGPSLVGLRLVGLAAVLVTLGLVALCARELHGGPRTQAAAALALALTPYGLGAGAIYHPTLLDLPVWAAILYLALRIVGRPEPRLWPALGLVAAVGLEAKDTVLALLGVLVVALVAAGPRAVLRDRRVAVAAAIALAGLAPNLVWQELHGWPSLAFFASQSAATAADASPPAYFAQQAAFLAGALPLVVVGTVALWRQPGARALALVFPLAVAGFAVERGRSYYALPAVVLPLAAGVVAAGRVAAGSPRRRLGLATCLAVPYLAAAALIAPAVWPVLPERTMVDRGLASVAYFEDEIGWPELADEVARAWRGLPPSQRATTAIVARNYGEAGALALYGPARGLPAPLSGHLSFQYWRPRALPQTHAILVGFDADDAARLCRSSRVVGRIGNRLGVDNEERGRTLTACVLRRPLGELFEAEIATNRL